MEIGKMLRFFDNNNKEYSSRIDLEIINIILTKGINGKDEKGETPLHKAAKKGDIDLVKLLLKNGADVNAMVMKATQDEKNDSKIQDAFWSEEKGFTPLHYAVLEGHTGVAYALLTHTYEKQDLQPADLNIRSEHYYTPLCLAIYLERENIVQLLLTFGAKVDEANGPFGTPLHQAAQRGNIKIMELLITFIENIHHPHLGDGLEGLHIHRAAMVNSTNSGDILKRSPIHIAAIHDQVDAIHFLLKHDSLLHAEDAFKKTPLHLAVENHCLDAIDCLHEYGANLEVKDMDGKTPLDYADSLTRDSLLGARPCVIS